MDQGNSPEIDSMVAERLDAEMAPLEERERRQLIGQAGAETAAQFASRRKELIAEGIDEQTIEDLLEQESADLTSELRREVQEDLRVRLAGERRLRSHLIRNEVEDELGWSTGSDA